MLYVSRYSNPILKGGAYTCVRISTGKPKWTLPYPLAGDISILAPYGIFGTTTDYDTFKRLYIQRLEKSGTLAIGRALSFFRKQGKDVVLLCFEDVRKEGEWCHRSVFAEWWQKSTGEIVAELRDPTIVKDTMQRAKQKSSEAEPLPSFVQLSFF